VIWLWPPSWTAIISSYCQLMIALTATATKLTKCTILNIIFMDKPLVVIFLIFILLVFGCNFDTSMCGFVQSSSDNFNWKRHQGRTPSRDTGPSTDHTSGNGMKKVFWIVSVLFLRLLKIHSYRGPLASYLTLPYESIWYLNERDQKCIQW